MIIIGGGRDSEERGNIMNLQTSTLAERISDFFKNSFHYFQYAAASAAGAAVIAFSSSGAAQASPGAPAPRPHLDAALQQNLHAFKEICSNPTYMGLLTQYSLTCEGVDEQYIRLRLQTPIGRPDKQDSSRWRFNKFGDVPYGFDFLVTQETKRIMAQGIADLHNNAVRAKNRNAPASDLIDPSLIDIVSAGAESGGGSRLEVVYDVAQHRAVYKTFGQAMQRRMKQRYGLNTPVWLENEVLELDANLLRHMNVSALREKIRGEEKRLASAREMYGAPGTIVFEKVDPATGTVAGIVEAKSKVFELAPGVYVPRSKDARNFTSLVDVNGDGKTDIDSAFDFSSGWQGTVRVRDQYIGAQRISPDVRKGIEREQTYIVRVASAQPAAGTESVPPIAPPPGAAPAAPGTPPAGAGPAPPISPPAAAPPAETPPTLFEMMNAEAAGMFVRLDPYLNVALKLGYEFFTLDHDFEQSRISARSNADGPTIAGSIGGIIGGYEGIAWNFAFDYFAIKDGDGTVTQHGNNAGEFTYGGSLRTMAAEVAYARVLNDHRSEPDRYASRQKVYLGLRAEQASANIDGTNVTANEQTTNALLAVLGLDHASASLDGADHAVSVRLGAGVNNQSNTNGIDYDAGFSARIAAEYLARFGEIGLTAGTDLEYNNMSTGTRGQQQERDEISGALHGDVAYLWGDARQHQAGFGVAHRSTFAKNTAAQQPQISETLGDTRLEITADFAF